VGSYFTVQLLVNILTMALDMGVCMGPEYDDLAKISVLLNVFLAIGIAVVGTNLLCHRYLLQKAKVMVKMSVSPFRIK
jgi:hypothetical protein